MHALVIGDINRYKKYVPDLPIVQDVPVTVVARGTDDESILRACPDAEFIVADAVSPVSARLMEAYPNLKLVHSEGVAFNAIDIDHARQKGVFVCNNAGANADAVAEQAILLMLCCLRSAVAADAAVRKGRQIQFKERLMVEGIRELGDCKVGLIGMGAIAAQTARRLRAFGCDVRYWNRTRRPIEFEEELGIAYLPLDELASSCDIVSIHVPVAPDTENLVDAKFIAAMKDDAILINTARGEIVDQVALADALERGTLGAAGMDTLSPEPVTLDHPLVNLSDAASSRIVFSPHIGGVTEGMFRRAWRAIWENIQRISSGERPANIVNGL